MWSVQLGLDRVVGLPAPIRASFDQSTLRSAQEREPVREADLIKGDKPNLTYRLTDRVQELGAAPTAAGTRPGYGPRLGPRVSLMSALAQTRVPVSAMVTLREGSSLIGTRFCEGIHYRYAAGQTAGTGSGRIGDIVEPLVSAGPEVMAG